MRPSDVPDGTVPVKPVSPDFAPLRSPQDTSARLTDALTRAQEPASLLTDIVESISDAFVVYDREWRIRYINQSGREALMGVGVTGSIVGCTIWELVPPLADTEMGRQLKRAMADRTATRFESPYGSPDSWIEVRAYPTADGGLSVIWKDVTPARRAADAARFLADASRELSSTLDPEQTLARLAQACVPFLGDWCAVDIIVDPSSAAWPPTVRRLAVVHDDPEQIAFVADYERRNPTNWDSTTGLPGVLRSGKASFVPVITEELLRAAATSDENLADLRRFRFASYLAVPLIARGRTLGALTLAMTESRRHYSEDHLALAQNIADRAASALDNAWLFQEAERARVQAESASRAKAAFLAVMSHELRTPINAIIGYTELIADEVVGPLNDTQRTQLSRVKTSARHLLALIENVLTLSRVEAGKLSMNIEDVDACAVARDAAALLAPAAIAKGLRYDVNIPDGRCIVVSDSTKVRQILINLLSNAVKFTERGSVSLTVRQRDTDLVFEVRDTGVGVAPADVERIFDAFWQGERIPGTHHAGAGLGLNVTRELTARLGGTIHVASNDGQGTVFTVVLPAESNADAAP
jgi:signal transduction histidine kinase